MKTILFSAIIATLLITSCTSFNNKLVLRKNYIYKFDTPVAGSAIDEVFIPTGSFTTTSILEDGNHLIISVPNAGTSLTSTLQPAVVVAPPFPAWKPANQGAYYFGSNPLNTDATYNARRKNKFRYLDQKIVLQTLTIPLKIRPGIKTNVVYKDTFPGTVETAVNFGLSFGWKGTYNVYNYKKNSLGLNTNKYSLAAGALFSIGSVSLDKTNTRDKVITYSRKAATLSPGAFIAFGFNSVHIGGAIGIDIATGDNCTQWVYNQKPWYGIIFALDIIK